MRGWRTWPAGAHIAAPALVVACCLAPGLGAEITGTVVDDVGEPIAGARVYVYSYDAEPRYQAQITTDRLGRYGVRYVPEGRYTVTATAARHQSAGRTATVGTGQVVRFDLQLTASCWLTGKVLLGSGEPLPNERVTLYFPSRQSIKPVRAGPDGEYRTQLPRPVIPDILAMAPGRGCVRVPTGVPSPRRDTKTADIVFDPDAPPIVGLMGTVTGDLGDPVAGAKVSLSRADHLDGAAAQAQTDAGGRFAVYDVLPGPHTLTVSVPGHEGYSSDRDTVTLPVGEVARRDVSLQRICSISGTIFGPTEVPLGDTKVAMHFRTYGGWRSRTLTTQPDGGYTAQCPEPCVADIALKVPGYAAVERRSTVLALGEEVSAANFILEGLASSIAGIVYERDGTTPKPETGVWLVMLEGPKWKRMSGRYDLSSILRGSKNLDSKFTPAHPRTKHDGTFLLEDIEAGTYRIVAPAPGYLPQATEPIVVGRSENVAGVRIALRRAASISGALYGEDGQPLAHRRVASSLRMDTDAGLSARSVPLTTDERGRYCIRPVWPGRWDMQVRVSDAAPATRQVQVGEGQDVDGVDFRMTQGNVLAVQVVGLDGEPARDASVLVRSHETAGRYRLYSAKQSVDDSGTARFEHLPEGAYTVCAGTENIVQTQRVGAVLNAPGRVQTVRIALQRGATIHGRVVDDGGNAVAGAKVRAYRRVPSPAGPWLYRRSGPIVSLTSDADGRFVVRGAGAGNWLCSAEAPGHVRDSTVVELEARGEHAVEVVLQRAWAGTLRGQILMPDGVTPAARTEFRALPLAQDSQGKSVPAGIARFLTDAKGRFRVTVKRPAHTAKFIAAGLTPTTVDIEPFDAETALVTVRIPPLTGIRGTVKLGDLKIPPDGLYVLAPPSGEYALRPEHFGKYDWVYRTACATVRPGETQWQILGLEPGEYGVFTYAPGLAPSLPASVEVPEGEIVEITVDVAVPGAVTGRVLTAGGEPVAGVSVSASVSGGARILSLPTPRARTDEQGYYRIENLTPGSVTLRAYASDYAYGPSQQVALLPRMTVHDIDFALERAGEVRGIVKRRDGRALRGRPIVALRAGPPPDRRHSVRGDGTFRFTRVRPGRYRLSLRERDTDALLARHPPITVSADEIIDGIEFVIDE
ncbi:MAG: carboxypeptidase regulatory-like domain-containing protein [Armatimonadota bacterium]